LTNEKKSLIGDTVNLAARLGDHDEVE
jgi:class 3 adenylate cyclase